MLNLINERLRYTYYPHIDGITKEYCMALAGGTREGKEFFETTIKARTQKAAVRNSYQYILDRLTAPELEILVRAFGEEEYEETSIVEGGKIQWRK